MPMPPVLALGEVIDILGLSKTRIAQLIATGDFPTPIAQLGVGKIWATPDVIAWCDRTGRKVHQPAEDQAPR